MSPSIHPILSVVGGDPSTSSYCVRAPDSLCLSLSLFRVDRQDHQSVRQDGAVLLRQEHQGVRGEDLEGRPAPVQAAQSKVRLMGTALVLVCLL